MTFLVFLISLAIVDQILRRADRRARKPQLGPPETAAPGERLAPSAVPELLALERSIERFGRGLEPGANRAPARGPEDPEKVRIPKRS